MPSLCNTTLHKTHTLQITCNYVCVSIRGRDAQMFSSNDVKCPRSSVRLISRRAQSCRFVQKATLVNFGTHWRKLQFMQNCRRRKCEELLRAACKHTRLLLHFSQATQVWNVYCGVKFYLTSSLPPNVQHRVTRTCTRNKEKQVSMKRFKFYFLSYIRVQVKSSQVKSRLAVVKVDAGASRFKTPARDNKQEYDERNLKQHQLHLPRQGKSASVLLLRRHGARQWKHRDGFVMRSFIYSFFSPLVFAKTGTIGSLWNLFTQIEIWLL